MSKQEVIFGTGAFLIVDLTDGKRFNFTHQMSYKFMTDHSLVDMRDSSGSLTDARNGESTYQIEIAANDVPPELCDRYMGAVVTETAAAVGLTLMGAPTHLSGVGSSLVGLITTAGTSLDADAKVGTYVATRDADGDVTFERVGAESYAGAVDVATIFSGTPTLTGTGVEEAVFTIIRNKQIGHNAEYNGNPKRPRFLIVVSSEPAKFTGTIEVLTLPECVPEGGAFESERLSYRESTLTFKLIGGKFTRKTTAIQT